MSEAQMVNGINIRAQHPILEILGYLEQGRISFEQAIGAIRKGGLSIVGDLLPAGMEALSLRMDLGNITPYL